MKSKKVFKLVLSIILLVACKSPEKSEPLPSIGTLIAKPEATTITLKLPINLVPKSEAITILGFNENIKNEIEYAIDVLYTIKSITVTEVQASSTGGAIKSVPSKEDVQKAILEGSFEVVHTYGDVFNEVFITFANDVEGLSASQNATKIANAIGKGNTASITLKVEASANASIEGKYEPSTFDIRFGIIVQ